MLNSEMNSEHFSFLLLHFCLFFVFRTKRPLYLFIVRRSLALSYIQLESVTVAVLLSLSCVFCIQQSKIIIKKKSGP